MNGLIVYWRGEKDAEGAVPQGLENLIMNADADTLTELESLVAEAKMALDEDS